MNTSVPNQAESPEPSAPAIPQSTRTRRCPECFGVGTQLYGQMGVVYRSTCAKCHGVGQLVVKPRRRAPDLSAIYFRQTSLRIALEELQKAVKWRDISLSPCSESVRRMARAVMRRAALNSRTSYAGGLICAN